MKNTSLFTIIMMALVVLYGCNNSSNKSQIEENKVREKNNTISIKTTSNISSSKNLSIEEINENI